MHAVDIDWMLHITKTAGNIALDHFGNTTGTLKPDSSWVTQADLDVEAYLRKELAHARPDDAILGEEGDDPPPEVRNVWAIDPVDGTRAFNHGFPIWGVSLGYLQNGIPTAGAFILPALGDLYHTDGTTAYYNGIPLEPPTSPINENAVCLISETALKQFRIDYPGRVLSLGSAAAHLAYFARGSAVAALDRASIWDYAAVAAILRVLGIPFRYRTGEIVDFKDLYSGKPVHEPTLICLPEHFETLQKALGNSGF